MKSFVLSHDDGGDDDPDLTSHSHNVPRLIEFMRSARSLGWG